MTAQPYDFAREQRDAQYHATESAYPVPLDPSDCPPIPPLPADWRATVERLAALQRECAR